jgi:putative membrane protein
MTNSGTGPRVFRLDRPAETPAEPAREPTVLHGGAVLESEPDAFDAPPDAQAPLAAAARRRGFSWSGLFLGSAAALLSLAGGLALDNLIRDLFARQPAMGWVALALAGLAALALAVMVGREMFGFLRERRIARLQSAATQALAQRDAAAASALARDLVDLYASRPETAAGRAQLQAQADTIIDADDRLAMAERMLLAPLDLEARRAVADVSRQVAGVTAISPRAVVDLAFVVFAVARLIRRVAAIYGGRPGPLGLLRLARTVFAHLVLTGGMAAGDTLIQQVLGQGLAARLSARLGEGVVNGLLTARVGLAAIDVCRPLPFIRARPPELSDVAARLLDKSTPGPD